MANYLELLARSLSKEVAETVGAMGRQPATFRKDKDGIYDSPLVLACLASVRSMSYMRKGWPEGTHVQTFEYTDSRAEKQQQQRQRRHNAERIFMAAGAEVWLAAIHQPEERASEHERERWIEKKRGRSADDRFSGRSYAIL